MRRRRFQRLALHPPAIVAAATFSLGALAVPGALGHAATASASAPPAVKTTAETEPGKGAGKVEGGLPEKLPASTKIKDCCGYPLSPAGGFHLTFYWVAPGDEYAWRRADTDLYDDHGLYIGTFPKAFVESLHMEGTGILPDGRMLNWFGRCHFGTGSCYALLDRDQFPSGRGVSARALTPFRSIAVDPKMIDIGEPVFLPELAGVVLPDGTIHDGCVLADDQGSRIRRRHIDFFVDDADSYHLIEGQLGGRDAVTPVVAAPRCRYLVDPEPHTGE